MKNYLVFLLVMGFSAFPAAGQDLTPQAFLEKMKSMPQKTVLDVRTPAEVAATGTLPGALVLDFNAPDFMEKAARLDRHRPVFVYCAIGGRSSKAAQLLEKQGFKTVFNLSGGMNAWQAARLPAQRKTNPGLLRH